VTQLDGIPFSDCFKVLQYWVCARGADPTQTAVTCAVGVHFIKSTMMKGNITSGVREEMVPQVKRLLASIIDNIVNYATLSSAGKSLGSNAVEQSTQVTESSSGRKRSVSSAAAAAAVSSSSTASDRENRHAGGVLGMFEDRTFTMTVVGVLGFIVLYQFYSQSVILSKVSHLGAKIDKLESAIKAFMTKQ
jgi:hypothetical protein